MKLSAKIFLCLLATLLPLSAFAASPKKKTSRQATSNAAASKTSMPNLIKALENVGPDESFNYNLDKADNILTTYVDPIIASKYPALKNASVYDRCDKVYDLLSNYISNSRKYQEFTSTIGEGCGVLASFSAVSAYADYNAILRTLPSEESKDCFKKYFDEVLQLNKKVATMIGDRLVMENGAGSYLIYEYPATLDAVWQGINESFNEIGNALAGKAVDYSDFTPREGFDELTNYFDYKNFDSDELFGLGSIDTNEYDSKFARLASSYDSMEQAWKKWIATLPAETAEKLTPMLADIFLYIEGASNPMRTRNK